MVWCKGLDLNQRPADYGEVSDSYATFTYAVKRERQTISLMKLGESVQQVARRSQKK
jgi:hypothetical protein